MNARQPDTELANTCRSAHAVQDSLSWHGRTQIRAETSLLAGRRSREIDHPLGEVDGVVAKPLVETGDQRQLHRHR
jgi:hypothetical protein